MKKIVFTVSLLLIMLLPGCGGPLEKPGADSDSSSASQSQHLEQSSTPGLPQSGEGTHSEPETEIISRVEISPQDADAGLIEALGENLLTEGQQNAMLQLVQNVVAGYHSGVLPLPVLPESEYFLNDPIPEGALLPDTVSWQNLRWSSFDEMWHMQGTLPLNDGNVLRVWLSQMSEDGKYFIYINEAKFDTEPAGEANNAPLTEDESLRLQAQAEVLTEHIVTKALEHNASRESSPVGDIEIRNFILGLAFYMDNTAHPYYNMISQTPEHLYIFPLKNVQRMAYELFGKENWDFDSTMEHVSYDFNGEKQQYESGLEFGLGGGYFDCKEMNGDILPDGQTIKVDFMLYSYLEDESDPTWGEAKGYSMYFTIVQENDALFLRYSTFQPA